MYSLDIAFKILDKRNDDDASNAINRYLSSCRMNGQISDREWPIIYRDNSYIVNVMTPEKTSLNPKFDNDYVNNAKKELASFGLNKPKILSSGKDIESSIVGKLDDSEYLILFTNFLSLESPIKSGKDFRPIPLYNLPKTYDKEYYDIICWQSDYKYCDELQMGCETGERFGTKEISDVESSLSKRGIKICKNISELVNIPCYYYLYKGNGRSANTEANRTCPICGSEKWKLEEPLHSIFDFKCDKCRIVSNIAWTLTYA